jgi:dipicolinate synthase subunit A
MSLAGVKAALIGGDARELEILRLMKAEGMEVRVIGLPTGAEAITGRPQEKTMADAVTGARALVLPIPGLGVDDSIYAPKWPEKLYLRPDDLKRCAASAMVVMGWASSTLAKSIGDAGMRLREYEKDDELMILRSRAIAEGALRIAIENTEVTLHREPVFVLGFGRVAQTLVGTLLALRADVTLVARNPVQLARAWEMGAEPVELKDLASRIGRAKVIMNTAPARLLDEKMLALTAPDALIMDLSAPPGGVDFEAAKKLGRKAIWARGLGSRAPITVGRSQWKGVRRILAEELGG